MEPGEGADAAIILKFIVQDADDGEKELSDSVKVDLDQKRKDIVGYGEET